MATVQITDVICRGCRMPHRLNENGLCEFCRRESPAISAELTLSDKIIAFTIVAILAMIVVWSAGGK